MTRKYKKPGRAPTRVSEAKQAMSYRLSPAKIARAQEVLGTATATATIEEALDAIVLRRELMEGLDRAFGLPIIEAYPDPAPRRR